LKKIRQYPHYAVFEGNVDSRLISLYIILMNSQTEHRVGMLIHNKRVSIPMTMRELSAKSGVSQSHIGRIERGERFPSAHVLQRFAEPLGFEEEELFTLAGFFSDRSNEDIFAVSNKLAIDPLVANMLAHEPVELQRAIMDVFNLLKIVAKYQNNSDK
jgi:transcriptional regulator with XRE-family HTH domain